MPQAPHRADGQPLAHTHIRLAHLQVTEIGYDVVKPEGAFYLWLRALEPDDAAFAERATKERIYMVYSGDFGCPGYERLSYSSVSRERLAESLSAFQNLWDSYGGYTW